MFPVSVQAPRASKALPVLKHQYLISSPCLGELQTVQFSRLLSLSLRLHQVWVIPGFNDPPVLQVWIIQDTGHLPASGCAEPGAPGDSALLPPCFIGVFERKGFSFAKKEMLWKQDV